MDVDFTVLVEVIGFFPVVFLGVCKRAGGGGGGGGLFPLFFIADIVTLTLVVLAGSIFLITKSLGKEKRLSGKGILLMISAFKFSLAFPFLYITVEKYADRQMFLPLVNVRHGAKG